MPMQSVIVRLFAACSFANAAWKSSKLQALSASEKDAAPVKVMYWNVDTFSYDQVHRNKAGRQYMFDKVGELNPDVLIFGEGLGWLTREDVGGGKDLESPRQKYSKEYDFVWPTQAWAQWPQPKLVSNNSFPQCADAAKCVQTLRTFAPDHSRQVPAPAGYTHVRSFISHAVSAGDPFEARFNRPYFGVSRDNEETFMRKVACSVLGPRRMLYLPQCMRKVVTMDSSELTPAAKGVSDKLQMAKDGHRFFGDLFGDVENAVIGEKLYPWTLTSLFVKDGIKEKVVGAGVRSHIDPSQPDRDLNAARRGLVYVDLQFDGWTHPLRVVGAVETGGPFEDEWMQSKKDGTRPNTSDLQWRDASKIRKEAWSQIEQLIDDDAIQHAVLIGGFNQGLKAEYETVFASPDPTAPAGKKISAWKSDCSKTSPEQQKQCESWYVRPAKFSEKRLMSSLLGCPPMKTESDLEGVDIVDPYCKGKEGNIVTSLDGGRVDDVYISTKTLGYKTKEVVDTLNDPAGKGKTSDHNPIIVEVFEKKKGDIESLGVRGGVDQPPSSSKTLRIDIDVTIGRKGGDLQANVQKDGTVHVLSGAGRGQRSFSIMETDRGHDAK